MILQNGSKALKFPLALLVVFHHFDISFKTQIKELKWIYLIETKRKILKKIKIQRKIEK